MAVLAGCILAVAAPLVWLERLPTTALLAYRTLYGSPYVGPRFKCIQAFVIYPVLAALTFPYFVIVGFLLGTGIGFQESLRGFFTVFSALGTQISTLHYRLPRRYVLVRLVRFETAVLPTYKQRFDIDLVRFARALMLGPTVFAGLLVAATVVLGIAYGPLIIARNVARVMRQRTTPLLLRIIFSILLPPATVIAAVLTFLPIIILGAVFIGFEAVYNRGISGLAYGLGLHTLNMQRSLHNEAVRPL